MIFAGNVITVSMRGANDITVNFRCPDAEVDRIGRVPYSYFRRLFGRPSIDRLVLRETGQPRGARPHRLIEVSIDRRDSIDPRNCDVGVISPPVVDQRGVLHQSCREKRCDQHGRRIYSSFQRPASFRSLSTTLSCSSYDPSPK